MDEWERWLAVDRFRGSTTEEVHAGIAFIAAVRERLVQEAAVGPGDIVLEIGCGAGEFLPRLLAVVGATGQVLALDHSPGLCAQAEAALSGHPARARLRVDQGDMRRLPYPDASVDVVLCRSVLQYAEDGLPAVAEEIARVLRPGGRMAAFEVLPGDGTPLLPVPRGEGQRRAHAEAMARWAGLPYALSRAALAAAFGPPLFRPTTIFASVTEWQQPYAREVFATILDQVPRPGCPSLADLYTRGLSPELRQGWEALLADATDQAQRGAWAYLSARRSVAG